MSGVKRNIIAEAVAQGKSTVQANEDLKKDQKEEKGKVDNQGEEKHDRN
jgi:hypothetical protein